VTELNALSFGVVAMSATRFRCPAVAPAAVLLHRWSNHGSRIEMRFFGGLTAEESAEVLGSPVQKVRAELRVAQAWLKRELQCSFRDRTNGSDIAIESLSHPRARAVSAME
jgi:hypothetical protein